jgi:hypothetical protein
MTKMKKARCKLCDTILVEGDDVYLMVLMASHLFQKHFKEKKYEPMFTELAKFLKEDFEILEEKVEE